MGLEKKTEAGMTETSISINTEPGEVFLTHGGKIPSCYITLAQSECEHLFLARYYQGVYN